MGIDVEESKEEGIYRIFPIRPMIKRTKNPREDK